MTTRPLGPEVTHSHPKHSARPGATPAHELVPPRHALRVGDIDVLVISAGAIPLPASTPASNAEPAELSAWLADRSQGPGAFTWPLDALVPRSGGRAVLVEAGMVAEHPDEPRHGGLPGAHLDCAGIDPAEITDVVITHLHVDLVGGMPEVLRSAELRLLEDCRHQLRPFEDGHEVAPGVVVQHRGGHTPGHSAVRLASGRDRPIFLGDAVFPNHFDRPAWHNAFDHDPEEAIRVRLLRELAASREPLLSSRLSFPSLGPVALDGDAFRWVPASWDH